MRDLERRLALHRAYWAGGEMEEPLVSYRIGNYFFADKFKANLPLLEKNHLVTPEQIDVDAYLPDYERMYQACEQTGQTAFFTAEPCTGIPWLEAMCGCPIRGEEVAFMATQTCDDIEDVGEICYDPENPWAKRYMEFLDKLVTLSDGRFPVGQPIMRGTTDVVGSMMGQSEMACAAMSDPELLRQRLNESAELLRQVIAEQYRHVPAFYDGWAAGFYHLWAPGKLIWYQEDLSAILSKKHFDEFLREPAEQICEGYDYTFMHLHPNSFFHLDGILSLKGLRAVQINKDVSGPTVEQMIPVFRKVLEAGKRLIVWGNLTEEEIRLVMRKLPHMGLFLNVISPSVDEAKQLQSVISTAWS